MTRRELKKHLRRCGLTLRNDGLDCTLGLGRTEKISIIQADENFIKVVFPSPHHTVQVTAWRND